MIKKLYPFDYSITGGGSDKAIRFFRKFFLLKCKSLTLAKAIMIGKYLMLGKQLKE